MNRIILYGSRYGTAKEYAQEFGRRTDTAVMRFDEADDISRYDTIVYFGAVYAGEVMGMKKTFKGLKNRPDRRIIIVTVGLADPDDPAYTETLDRGIRKQLPDAVGAGIYHLRGAIDYTRLSFAHKTMLGMLYKASVNLPEEKKTAEIRAIIETYQKQVSRVDYSSLEPIVQAVGE